MIKIIICAVVSTLALGACSSTPAWKTAKVAEPLTMPAGVDTPGTSNELAVPNVASTDKNDGLLRSTRPPATNQIMTLAETTDVAFKDVGSVLTEAGVGKIVESDPATHSYRLVLSADEVNPGHRSLRQRMFHRSPDVKGTHDASVTLVDDGKGRSNVVIDGDDLAVQKLYKVLKSSSKSIGTVAADEGLDPDAGKKP